MAGNISTSPMEYPSGWLYEREVVGQNICRAIDFYLKFIVVNRFVYKNQTKWK